MHKNMTLGEPMQQDLTRGNVTKSMLLFAVPMILGNLLQQFYNIADTFIVGQFLGSGALAAVGSSFALMTFLTSILLGLCMGSGIVFSMQFGAGKDSDLKDSIFISFILIGILAILIEGLVLLFQDPILHLLQIPASIMDDTRIYLQIIYIGILFTFLYNFFASLLRSVGNSVIPLVFLAVSTILNIVLDLVFILHFHMGVAGAAWATTLAQGVSAIGIVIYAFRRLDILRALARGLYSRNRVADSTDSPSALSDVSPAQPHITRASVSRIMQYSFLTCIQQSIMNFGILMIQGLVNSFGVTVMAAFAAAVKIDSFAYMPVQDFGNAFSTFIAQNYGADKKERIRHGIRSAGITTLIFCMIISVLVCLFAAPLMTIFVRPEETDIIAIGVQYLRIEGSCYCGIGILFLLYGLYRALGRPGMSVVLTIISLGTRVVLAYALAPVPAFGLPAIWWAIPIGWALADITGIVTYMGSGVKRSST